MPTVNDNRHVNINYVTFLQSLFSGNSMADNVIDRRANGFREPAVTKWCGYSAMIDDEIVTQLI